MESHKSRMFCSNRHCVVVSMASTNAAERSPSWRRTNRLQIVRSSAFRASTGCGIEPILTQVFSAQKSATVSGDGAITGRFNMVQQTRGYFSSE